MIPQNRVKPAAAVIVVPHTRISVTFTCLLIEMMFLITICDSSSTGGGGYVNPSMYGTYQNSQQQWQPQQHEYQANNQYQQQQQQQQQQQEYFEQPSNIEDPVVTSPLPPGWSEHTDPSSGQLYYYNSNDGLTTWDRPPPLPTGNETSTDENEGHLQQHDISQTFTVSHQDHSNSTEINDSLLTQDTGNIESTEQSNRESSLAINDKTTEPSDDGDVLTSIRRDENQILEEERWRASHGWNEPSDISEGSHNTNTGIATDTPKRQQPSQGWNLPPQHRPTENAWGLAKVPPGNSEHMSVNQAEKMPISQPPDPYRRTDETIPTSNQPQQQQQHSDPPNFSKENIDPAHPALRPNANVGSPPNSFRKGNENIHQDARSTGQQRGSDSNSHVEQPFAPANRQGQYQQQIPQHQKPQHQQDTPHYLQQQPPPTGFSRPPPVQSNPYQNTQPYLNSQQRPISSGQPPYSQQQGGRVYSQQPQHPQSGAYGQTPQQYGERPVYNQYPPPNQPNPQQNYGSHSVGQGGQLITQEQQNMVKESLGRTWQNILGLKDKTKEVVESATNTVAQSAREATQTITERGTGWWGQAKSVLGSVFESEPTSEYSLSGIYGNAPPAPMTQEQSRNFPMNQNYPPQSRYPPYQNYPPQGSGQQQLPPRGAYPPGYGPPQPRVDAPYPYQQQGSRQAIPTVKVGGNAPHQGYPPQTRPYDPSRPDWNQPARPGLQAPPLQQQQEQQQPPRKPDDSNSAWSHPGLGSDY